MNIYSLQFSIIFICYLNAFSICRYIMFSIFPCFIYVDDRNVNLVKLIFRLYIPKVVVKVEYCKVEILVLLNLHFF